MRRRMGRPGLIGTMARTAVVAGTATAVVGGVQGSRAAKAQQGQQSQAQMAQMQSELDAMNAEKQAAAQQAAIDKGVEERLAAQPAPAAPAAGGDDIVAQLQKLADMKSQGLLSDAEFAAMKSKLLGI